MPEDEWTQEARDEWRQLGFHSLHDDPAKMWRLTGSREGLWRFAQLLRRYVANPSNSTLSEHEHHNPYGSLEIMTWGSAGLDGHSIHGTLVELERLARLVETALSGATPGSRVRIREDYAPDAEYALVLEVQEDGFDPASADDAISPEGSSWSESEER